MEAFFEFMMMPLVMGGGGKGMRQFKRMFRGL